jgi:uncharacterized protein DUF6575
MRTQIFLKDILLYYDTPQLFVARDAVGTNYICMVVEQNSDFDNYACVQISEKKLEYFSNGHIDLRAVFASPEIKKYYQAKIHDFELNFFEIIPLENDELPEEWLPDEGIVIKIAQSQSEIVAESKDKAKTIVYLSLNPPESANEPRINTLSLSEALLRFQTMLKYAYKKSIAKISYANRKQLNVPENYQLDVFAFAPGSFKVKMQSQSYPSLLGETEITRALHLVDQHVDNIDNVDSSLKLLSENKGHFANTYINFLKYIAESKSKLSYSWAFSRIKNPVTKQITSDQAQYLYEIFNQQDELKEETIELIGHFDKVDKKYGKWRLVDQENNSHNGELGEVEGLTLKGVIIGTKLYKLVCIEKITEVVGTSEEKKSIQLMELKQMEPESGTEQRH